MGKLIKNAQIIDLEKGKYNLCDILINDSGKVEEISKEIKVNKNNIEQIDLEGKFVIPGLINTHAHLFSSGNSLNINIPTSIINFVYTLLSKYFGKKMLYKIMKKNANIELNSGVTTLRSVGEFFYQDVKLRNDINNGSIIGPTLFVSGFFLSTTDGHGAPYLALESDSPWEGRKNVRKNVKHGVDWIKICVTGGVTDARRIGEAGALQLTLEEIEAICDEAHKNGTMVAAHVESTEGVRIALKGGVDTIEHGATMDQEIINLYKKNPNSLRGYSTVVPTLSAGIPSVFIDEETSEESHIISENGKQVFSGMTTSLKQAKENNISIGIGNDSSMAYVTHYDFWRELDYHIQFGNRSNREVLFNATMKNAEILGIDDLYGSLEKGKYADFIVMEKDPIKDIKSLQNLNKVFKHGKNVSLTKTKKITKIDNALNKISISK